MRRLSLLMTGLLTSVALHATILERLTVEQMTQQATSIVRAKVTGSRVAQRGTGVWTIYQLQVLETLKSTPGAPTQTEVAVPGGNGPGIRQVVAGAPTLTTGSEYVLFLWTSRSGLTQVIGLSQGLLAVTHDSAGGTELVRPASRETMLDANLRPVTDPGLNLRLSDLRSRVLSLLGAK